MSIKRHPALQPFSRDHVVGLYHAHQLMWLEDGRARCNAPTTVRNFLQAWDAELISHFAGEEDLLAALPIKEASKNKLFADHNELRTLCLKLLNSIESPNPALCSETGHKLEQHIRWEEREFFPEIEQALSEDELSALAEKTKEFELERLRSV